MFISDHGKHSTKTRLVTRLPFALFESESLGFSTLVWDKPCTGPLVDAG